MKRFYTKEQMDFVEEVRDWIHQTLDPKVRQKMLASAPVSFDEMVTWWRALNDKGWAAPAFPVEYGGTDWDVVKRNLFLETLAKEGAPQQNLWAVQMLGPVLLEFGSDAQKAEYIPRLLSVDDFWAQGFSEPGSGSDLASLKTKAEDCGDHWLVNGQKLWTSLAHHANKIFLLVRTAPNVKPQQGISMLLLDIDLPGIEIRPVKTLDHRSDPNEVFFDNVRVPKENIVGKPGQGWSIAKFLLSNERAGIAQVGKQKKLLSRLRKVAAESPNGGNRGVQLDNPDAQKKLRELEAELLGIEISNLRMLVADQVGAEASLLKLRSSQIEQKLNELALTIGGPAALPLDLTARTLPSNYHYVGSELSASLAPEYFISRAATIYGGTSEIQRNIVAKSVLGL